MKAGEILLVGLVDSRYVLLWRDALGFSAQHDRGSVRVIGAYVNAVVAAHFLQSDPDIRLNHFHQMAKVNARVGVGKSAGD
jgi:hypothetical protein